MNYFDSRYFNVIYAAGSFVRHMSIKMSQLTCCLLRVTGTRKTVYEVMATGYQKSALVYLSVFSDNCF